jgi:hypothetical protein
MFKIVTITIALATLSACTPAHPSAECIRDTRELRHWSRERDDRILVRDGYAPGPHPRYQIDHFVPLCLGGSDNDDNLWVQPYPQARWKDHDEVNLCRAVCEGKLIRQEAVFVLVHKWSP